MRHPLVPRVCRPVVSKIGRAPISPAASSPLGSGARPPAVRPGGPPRGAGPGRWAGFLLCASVVLLVLGWPVPGTAQTTCTSTSVAVTGFTGDLDGLVADCTTLLGLKDESAWHGHPELGRDSCHVLVGRHYRRRDLAAGDPSGSPRGVGEPHRRHPRGVGHPSWNLQNLDLTSNQLTVPSPRSWAPSRGLTVLRLTGNELGLLTGAIPAALGDLMNLQNLWLQSECTHRRHPRRVGRPHEPANLRPHQQCNSPVPSPRSWAPS